MKYLCLIYQQEMMMDSLPIAEKKLLMQECIAYSKHLEKHGYYVMGNALASPGTAKTLRSRANGFTTTDGPFIETKEQLAGYCLLDARDLNEAIHLAGNLPPARYGCVEIRPLREFPLS